MSEQQEPRFINPFTDFGFKKIFGEEANKDLLIDFLNEFLKKENIKIAELLYKKTDRLGTSQLDRNVVFDLYCENEKGDKFTVELQKAKQSYFKDRMLYYSSFSIQEQGVKGKDWDYKLKAVFVVGILDFIIDEANKDNVVVSHNKLMDIERHKIFYEKLSFITLQMPNFNKTVEELETHEDKWLYVLKHLHHLEEIPEKIQDKIFEKLFSVASYAAMNKQERQAYHDSVKYYNDLKNSLDTAHKEGREEAESELLPIIEQEREAKEKAKIQAEQERKEKEQERKEKELAIQKMNENQFKIEKTILKLYRKSFSIKEIADDLELTEKEVEEIIAKSK